MEDRLSEEEQRTIGELPYVGRSLLAAVDVMEAEATDHYGLNQSGLEPKITYRPFLEWCAQ